jgi:predicted outer membrane repeat protein
VLDVTIDRCTFESNTSENGGSALHCRIEAAPNAYNKILVQNSTFVDNTNKNGGLHTNQTAGEAAIHVEQAAVGARSGEMKFINNTIAYNKTEKTSGIGGFLNQQSPIVTVINNISYSNYNAAPVNYSFRSMALLVESRNNIVDGVVAGHGLNNATVFSGNIEGITGGGLKLAARENLADNGGATKTLSIDAESAAIDAGYATGVPTVDQRGAARVGTPDIGAYERLGIFSSVHPLDQKPASMFIVSSGGLIPTVDCTLRIYTFNGSEIKNKSTKSGQMINLPAGAYIVRAITKDGSSVQKVIL